MNSSLKAIFWSKAVFLAEETFKTKALSINFTYWLYCWLGTCVCPLGISDFKAVRFKQIGDVVHWQLWLWTGRCKLVSHMSFSIHFSISPFSVRFNCTMNVNHHMRFFIHRWCLCGFVVTIFNGRKKQACRKKENSPHGHRT